MPIEIEPREHRYQYAILDNDKNVIGYFAYGLYPEINSVENFGLCSFEHSGVNIMKRSTIIGHDLLQKMDELVTNYHRVSWRMLSGNPVKRSYDRLAKTYNAHVVCLHDIIKDPFGDLHDEYIYEIINPDK